MLDLTTAEVAILYYVLSDTADVLEERLSDIGKDSPFSDPAERDEIKHNLALQIAVLRKVLPSLVAASPAVLRFAALDDGGGS